MIGLCCSRRFCQVLPATYLMQAYRLDHKAKDNSRPRRTRKTPIKTLCFKKIRVIRVLRGKIMLLTEIQLILKSRIKSNQCIILAAEMSCPVSACLIDRVEQIHVDFYDSFYITHKVVGSG